MIKLNNNTFWEWMKYNPDEKSGEGFWSIFDDLFKYEEEIDPAYIFEEQTEKHPFASSKIMDNLFQLMPREYFHELQFCAMTYTTFFSKVFPSLADKIDELAYIEWVLYSEPEKPDYRDHFVHMFKVAFAGVKLMEESDNLLLDKVTKKQFDSAHFTNWADNHNISLDIYNDKKRKDILKRAFFFAAMFHDFGFGYDFLAKYKKRLHGLCLPGRDSVDISEDHKKVILKSLAAQFVQDNHFWLLSVKGEKYDKLRTRIQDGTLVGFFKDCLNMNHSIASCLCVLEIAEKLKKSRAIANDVYLSFQIAAEAIMLHDMTSQKRGWAHLAHSTGHFLNPTIHDKIPMATLLILADELSIWDRHKFIGVSEERAVVIKYDEEWAKKEGIPSAISIEMNNNQITITDECVKDSEKSKLKNELEELSVFGKINEYQFLGLKLEINTTTNDGGASLI